MKFIHNRSMGLLPIIDLCAGFGSAYGPLAVLQPIFQPICDVLEQSTSIKPFTH